MLLYNKGGKTRRFQAGGEMTANEFYALSKQEQRSYPIAVQNAAREQLIASRRASWRSGWSTAQGKQSNANAANVASGIMDKPLFATSKGSMNDEQYNDFRDGMNPSIYGEEPQYDGVTRAETGNAETDNLKRIEEDKIIAEEEAENQAVNEEADRVSRIQRINGQENVDGIMGEETQGIMDRVKERQEEINKYMEENGDNSFVPLTVDGLNGSNTRAAFKAYNELKSNDLLGAQAEVSIDGPADPGIINPAKSYSPSTSELLKVQRLQNRQKLRGTNALRRQENRNKVGGPTEASTSAVRKDNRADRQANRQNNRANRKTLRESNKPEKKSTE